MLRQKKRSTDVKKLNRNLDKKERKKYRGDMSHKNLSKKVLRLRSNLNYLNFQCILLFKLWKLIF